MVINIPILTNKNQITKKLNYMYTLDDINKAKQYLSDNGYGTGSNFTLNTVANLMVEWAAKNPYTLDAMVSFLKWYEKLSPAEKCTVHAPAGSGGGHGLYNISNEDLVKRWLNSTEKPDSSNLRRRHEEIELLEAYSKFLEDEGYTDTDWRAEEPFAIDMFFKSKFYASV